MTLETLLKTALSKLQASKLHTLAHHRDSDFQQDIEILLAHCSGLGLSQLRVQMRTHPERNIAPDVQTRFFELLEKRMHKVPVAYLTGEQAFWSLVLKVNQHVLIPRQESECLVEFLLEQFKNDGELSGLDLATGSGALALALGHEKNHWQLCASDVSHEALDCAKHNAHRLQINNVDFIHSDWFKTIPQQRFDFIVSNPPYIEADAQELKHESIQFEPRIALVAGEEGLDAIRLICEQAKAFLKPEAPLVIEHGYQQAAAVYEIFLQNGFNRVECHKDYAQLDRFTVGFSE